MIDEPSISKYEKAGCLLWSITLGPVVAIPGSALIVGITAVEKTSEIYHSLLIKRCPEGSKEQLKHKVRILEAKEDQEDLKNLTKIVFVSGIPIVGGIYLARKIQEERFFQAHENSYYFRN